MIKEEAKPKKTFHRQIAFFTLANGLQWATIEMDYKLQVSGFLFKKCEQKSNFNQHMKKEKKVHVHIINYKRGINYVKFMYRIPKRLVFTVSWLQEAH